MVPRAYLRVFEPLDAFPDDDQQRWGRYVATSDGLTVEAALEAERTHAFAQMVTGRFAPDPDGALVRRVNGRVHVCPLQLADRQALVVNTIREVLPEAAIDAFVSREQERSAARRVERLYRPPHILVECWEVPLRWFALFDPGDRHFVDPPTGTGPRLTYLTTARRALERLDRVSAVVEAALVEPEVIVDAIAGLVEYVASFHDDSIIELDYGSLTSIIPVADLVTEDSCEDLWRVVEGLESGDLSLATARYEETSARWDLLRHRCRAN